MASGSPQSGVGRVIAGRYLLLNQLGSGGMGHVWLAYDQRLACEVALKEIVFRDPAEADHDRSARVARARAEARHAAGLRGHPHVVTVHDVLEHEGLPWIVMEYVAGALDLSALVDRRGAVAPAECARIGLAVLDALTAGHERGVMHRDVKPANILLAPDRTGSPYARVLLTDYGISVQPDGDETRWTLTSALVGTAGYLAPERAQGGPPTAAADLFSLGCTLYYAVEGYGPFERESGLAALTAVVLEEPRPVLHAGALEPLLSAMLTKDPVRRITAEETEAALSAILTPQPHPRTQLDPGSEPPWANGMTHTAAPRTPPAPEPPRSYGSGPQSYAPSAGQESSSVPPRQVSPAGWPPPQETPLPWPPGQAPAPWSTGQGYGPPPAATGRRRRERNHVLRAVLATALGLALAGGGAWYALANPPGDKNAKPYGDAIGLSKPLADGDCVATQWTSTPFVGDPELQVVKCLSEETYGQVMAVFEAASAQDARSAGATRCEQRTEETRRKLADVRSYAAVPTSDGFERADRRVACLVLDARGKPLFGPIGNRRPAGMRFIDTATMQKRDCLDRVNDNTAKLVSCQGPHQEQVLDFHRMSPDTTLPQARRRATAACQEEVPPNDHGYDPSIYTSSSWVGRSAWNSGTHIVVCTAIRQDGGTMEKNEP
ncbi:serine/threonine protein phosphatase [Streptomyces dioscori]|uniref:non-specific serine/threonine protein kinase n=1 Tax=Streptomyces dioscori TaxID=2109333 RepID=A0A2P8Q413_9ACTN|nr:serine/threonine-protein kinase [Streptomyces dioscori]PSM40996.1 serine/threonine protein phosphatase [Streptomyces dioscori]